MTFIDKIRASIKELPLIIPHEGPSLKDELSIGYAEHGWTFLNSHCYSKTSRYLVMCPNGHRISLSFEYFQKFKSCTECLKEERKRKRKRKMDLESLEKDLESLDLDLPPPLDLDLPPLDLDLESLEKDLESLDLDLPPPLDLDLPPLE